MKKLTDQELDSLFKNAAEGYKPAFDQAAWEAMDAKLDQPKPTFWKRWMPFAFLGLMIFSAGVWVGTYLNQTDTLSAPSQPNQDKELSQAVRITPQENEEFAQNRSTAIEQQSSQQNRITNVTNQNNQVILNSTAIVADAELSIVAKNNDNAIQLIDDNQSVVETPFLPQDQKKVKEPEVLINDQSSDSLLRMSKTESARDTVQSVSENKSAGEKVSRAHSFYLRLLASPDFSSINFSSTRTSGSNYALLFDYQLSNRWSISAGGIWSMKKYATDKEVTYGKYTADSMVGACRILDIPVNVYYRFFPSSKLSFITGLGFSSYVMLQEDYTYTFNFPSGSRDYSFYFEKKNNEWFKVLNVSLGVQYQISPRFHLQVEPFLKAPLQGVGEWDVRLSSLGVFMGLKYKIN